MIKDNKRVLTRLIINVAVAVFFFLLGFLLGCLWFDFVFRIYSVKRNDTSDNGGSRGSIFFSFFSMFYICFLSSYSIFSALFVRERILYVFFLAF